MIIDDDALSESSGESGRSAAHPSQGSQQYQSQPGRALAGPA
jgi:hypothetical protein